jgi:hypothetical protein
MGGSRAVAAPAAPPQAVLAGRIVFRDGARELRASDVERQRWGHLTVEVRHGWRVFAARPDEAGLFTITGPPGRYRFEYVRLGELAEFFPPQDVVADAGGVTCIGTLEVSVADVHDLGLNQSGGLRVRDDCAEMAPGLRALGAAAGAADGEVTTALARPAPSERKPISLLGALAGLRGQVAGNDNMLVLRSDLVVEIGEEVSNRSFIVGASASYIGAEFVNSHWPAPNGAPGVTRPAWGVVGGGGYSVSILEGQLFGGFLSGAGRGAHGPVAGASVRAGTVVWGFIVRGDLYPASKDAILTAGFDLSPIGLLGSLL